MALRMNHPSSGKTAGPKCAVCLGPAQFEVNDKVMGLVYFCSSDCHKKFYPQTTPKPGEIGADEEKQDASLEVHLNEIRINALIVEVIDYRTVKVIFIPYGHDMPVTVRLANGPHFNSHDIKTEEEKAERKKILNSIFFDTATESSEPTYPIASVIPVGAKQAKKNGGLIILVTVYVPSKCQFDDRLLVAMANTPDAVIGDLGTSQSFHYAQSMSESKLRNKQLTQSDIGAKDPRWMEHANIHPGRFTRWGIAHHIIHRGQKWTGSTIAHASRVAAKTPGKHDDRMASLAKTFARFRHSS